MDEEADLEIAAMANLAKALGSLEDEARGRVLRWAAERYGVSLGVVPRKHRGESTVEVADGGETEEGGESERENLSSWDHFAELYDASGASTHPDGMLVAAYWVQVLNQQESFGSLELNKLLKDLGHGVTGTAKVMTTLIEKKPALVLQLKKSGKSQQARKTYRLTDAGKKAVQQMIAHGA